MENSGWLEALVGSAFTKGLSTGLFACAVVFLRALFQKRRLARELKNLRGLLQTKLEIDAEEMIRRKDEIARLKEEKENLQLLVQELQQKPGRRELRQHYVTMRAVERMMGRAPGFAPAWQAVRDEAERDFSRAEEGLIPLLHRLFPHSTGAVLDELEKTGRRAALHAEVSATADQDKSPPPATP